MLLPNTGHLISNENPEIIKKSLIELLNQLDKKPIK